MFIFPRHRPPSGQRRRRASRLLRMKVEVELLGRGEGWAKGNRGSNVMKSDGKRFLSLVGSAFRKRDCPQCATGLTWWVAWWGPVSPTWPTVVALLFRFCFGSPSHTGEQENVCLRNWSCVVFVILASRYGLLFYELHSKPTSKRCFFKTSRVNIFSNVVFVIGPFPPVCRLSHTISRSSSNLVHTFGVDDFLQMK